MRAEPMPAPAVRDVVVVGASAGGVPALRKLAAGLPRGFPASVLVVLHTGAFPSQLPNILGMAGPNPALFAQHGTLLQRGTLVVAQPDRHLLVRDGRVRLTRGPKEHHTRPAIDPLFRSAALWGGARVIGVLLSGSNDDGTAGLQAIRKCGGLVLVQDPQDAEEPAMPRSAIRHVQVDRVVSADRVAEVLVEWAGQPVPASPPAPDALVREESVALGEGDPMEDVKRIGTASGLACPDCHGVLFELGQEQPVRYRCHTGHAFTVQTLQQAQQESTEEALWSAIRALQEKESLLRRVAELDRLAGDEPHADRCDADAERLADHVAALRRLTEES